MSRCARDDGGDEGSANCSVQANFTYRIHRADMTGTIVESAGRSPELGETEDDPSQAVQLNEGKRSDETDEKNGR
ncbi:hypothetical protein RUM43_012621 [Polyplax serrata]|uniref:Uncharacterized protein n=1 Tax=Polyplax serrata TaxID=468196 RepID=A0AAN8P5D7_POLSC